MPCALAIAIAISITMGTIAAVRFLGGKEPSRLRVVSPGQRFLARTRVWRNVSYVVRFCFGLVSGLFSFGVCFVICGLVRESKNGQVLGHNSWGRCFVLALCQVLHFGGGSRHPAICKGLCQLVVR